MLRVNQDGVVGFGGLDPFACVLNAAGVFGDRDDFKILAFQVAV
jgi:hypothetical protein